MQPATSKKRALLGLAVAMAVLVLVEIGLRLAVGAPEAPRPFVRVRWNMDGPAFQVRGDEVLPGYQGHDMVGPFPRAPSPGVPRVFVLGGSSIRGGSRIPAAHEAPALLAETMADSGSSIEVVNLGRPGLDSHHHLEILRQALAFEPDLVVLYMGHNDLGNAVLEDRYGTVGDSLGLRLRLVLGHLATYAALRDALMWPGASKSPSEEVQERAIADHHEGTQAGTQRSCPPGDTRRALAAQDLEANLGAMAAAARDAGAGVVMVTPVSDWVSAGPLGRSCPELLSSPSRAREPRGARGGTTLSADELEAALALRPGCPELLFERGLWRLKRGHAGAYQDLRAAMEGDVLPMRATRAITDAVRRAAARSGAQLLDLEAQVEAEHGAPPPTWFIDVVHLSAPGHAALAAALTPVVREELSLAAPPSTSHTSPPR